MIYVLRLLHVVFGVLWVGAVLFVVRLLMPSIRTAGPGGGAVMAELGKRKMSLQMMVMAIITIISGIWLLMIDSAGAPGEFMKTGPGHTFSLGGGLAILAAILGMAVSAPTMRRMGAIAAGAAQRGGPPTAEESAEMQRLQARMGTVTSVVAVLLVLATAAMAVARYI